MATEDDATIRTGFSLGTGNAGAVNAHPGGPWMLSQQRCCPDLAPAPLVDAAIFQRFIEAGPLAPKQGRERQLGKRAGLWLTREGVGQLQERIGAALKALVDLMTNRFQCVKVHLSNAPLLHLEGHYSLRQSSAMGIAFLAYGSLNTNEFKQYLQSSTRAITNMQGIDVALVDARPTGAMARRAELLFSLMLSHDQARQWQIDRLATLKCAGGNCVQVCLTVLAARNLVAYHLIGCLL